jgi:putative spermidine/putrescine transport system permease protein
LVLARSQRQVGRVAGRLNHGIPGYRSLILTTADRVSALARAIGEEELLDDERLLSRLTALDSRWGEPVYWIRLRQSAPPYTMVYLLRTVDRKFNLHDKVVQVSEDRRLFVAVFWRTVRICTGVTIITLILGFPIAYLMAGMPTRHSNIFLLFLLLPLWTSVLVKSLSWLVALQNEGVFNKLGIFIGLWDEPFELARNRLGTYISMVHVLLPFMTFPLYSVMKGIDAYHMKAAATMGAKPWMAFFKVYLPQTFPGVSGGVLLVYILALGLYVPPALVGGPADQMLSYMIAWGGTGGGLAAALSVVLLGLVGVFLFVFQRVVGINKSVFR